MNDPINPYAAPPTVIDELPRGEPLEIAPVSKGRRFATFVIDLIVRMALVFFGAIVTEAMFGSGTFAAVLATTGEFGFEVLAFLAYYWIFEVTTGRTPAKFIMGTRVVDEDGRRATSMQITGRTLARLIPFDGISIFNPAARAWHDSLSKTYVVDVR